MNQTIRFTEAKPGAGQDEICDGLYYYPGRVLWKNDDWAVTENGLDLISENQDYFISWDELDEHHPNWFEEQPEYSSFMHVGLKPWNNLENYIQAYAMACAIHGRHLPKKLFRETVDFLRDERAKEDARRRALGAFCELYGYNGHVIRSAGAFDDDYADPLDALPDPLTVSEAEFQKIAASVHQRIAVDKNISIS